MAKCIVLSYSLWVSQRINLRIWEDKFHTLSTTNDVGRFRNWCESSFTKPFLIIFQKGINDFQGLLQSSSRHPRNSPCSKASCPAWSSIHPMHLLPSMREDVCEPLEGWPASRNPCPTYPGCNHQHATWGINIWKWSCMEYCRKNYYVFVILISQICQLTNALGFLPRIRLRPEKFITSLGCSGWSYRWLLNAVCLQRMSPSQRQILHPLKYMAQIVYMNPLRPTLAGCCSHTGTGDGFFALVCGATMRGQAHMSVRGRGCIERQVCFT